ncbi:MAG: ABC-2 transporter permease [Erysipelotrichaceae bacterium]|nr:ABC-2 transporter permease [Erysipelotrichaceae bacterium]
MKALLIKDFKLIKQYYSLYLTFILVIYLSFLISNDDIIFSLVLCFFLLSMIVFGLSSISNDETYNSYDFMFSLPINHVMYVVEKYLFDILLGIITIILIYVYSHTISAFMHINDIINVNQLCIILLLSQFFLCAFLIPVRLYFTGEKQKLAIVSTIGFAIIMAYFIMTRFLTTPLINFGSITLLIDYMFYTNYINYLFVLSLILLLISIKMSLMIIHKKS